ncbi:unnamed protein product [Rodentolepis nana]|uniref:Uncharacterized protein n=1 Tax=Rodentolepis nana TaxID=102285 RepID=A0A3P7S2I2_RODNA|nr:unnamed protein product [Rodentolepis nana]
MILTSRGHRHHSRHHNRLHPMHHRRHHLMNREGTHHHFRYKRSREHFLKDLHDHHHLLRSFDLSVVHEWRIDLQGSWHHLFPGLHFRFRR